MKKILLSLLFSSTAVAEPGRFQLVQLGEFARNQYLLDTETGDVWNIVNDKDGDKIFQTVPFSCYSDDFKLGSKGSLKSTYCYVAPSPIEASKLP